MPITTLTLFEHWKLVIEAMAYVAGCAILLRILWLIVTVEPERPRPMWEKK